MPVVLVFYPMNFWFHVARLAGVLCDEEVTWATYWDPIVGVGGPLGEPVVWADGPHCIIYPPVSRDDREFLPLDRGTLTIYATVQDITYGPLELRIEESA